MKSVNETGAFLGIVGFIVLILGGIGTVYLATINGGFDIVIFIGGALSVGVSGGLVRGVGEIINKLHQIEINTSKKEYVATKKGSEKKVVEKKDNVKYIDVIDKCPACGCDLPTDVKVCPDCQLNFE